ncbi:MAG TPA: ribbon-helix-helix domain-containing protein [Nostocaceae cyanobacterium]|nr:ribbon-helix-helix domain-containing protein [Nostocaceae cyanobacterium]
MQITISLPDSLLKFVEEQVAKGGYSSVSEYLVVLILEEQKRQSQEKL